MSDKRSPADNIVQGATNRAALDLCIEPIRLAARSHGYAVALHGSVARDIDLIAIPWIENASQPDQLVDAVIGAIAGSLGQCFDRTHSKPKRREGRRQWTEKPHGRRVAMLHAWVGETSIHFDFGVMPLIPKKVAE